MKGVVIMMALLLMALFDGAVLEKDSLVKGRINIKSKTGGLKGWMKRDTLNPHAWFLKKNWE